MKRLSLLGLLFCITACSGVHIQRVDDPPPLPVPDGVKPQVIALGALKTLIPRGTNTAGFGPKGLTGILSCEFPWGPVQGVPVESLTNTTQIRQRFANTLESLGYDVAGNPGILFNADEDYMRTRYRIGARIIDMGLDLCARNDSPFPRLYRGEGLRGEANVTVEWVVFDGLMKETVYKTTTIGYADLTTPMQEGQNILLEDAIASAVHKLGTDPKFHALIFEGIDPAMGGDDFGIDRDRFQNENWQDVISLPMTKPFGKNFDKMVQSTVLIETGAGGHGSGFFIADDLILTNAHVVGYADQVRVSTSGKAEKFLARVIRTDRPRDLALIRLDHQIDRAFYTLAPLSTAHKPKVGDKVFAVGAPRLKKLQDTITSGMVSAWRYEKRERQYYIQSDVDIYPGNSGGPLYNDQGAVIGVSVSGFSVGDSAVMGGLNWFIPIQDALSRLDISGNRNES